MKIVLTSPIVILLFFICLGDCQASPKIITLLATEDPQSLQAHEANLRAVLRRDGHAPASFEVISHNIPYDDFQPEARVRKVLEQDNPDIVVALNMELAKMAQGIDTRRPVIFAGAGDPVSMCLTDNLVRPGRNATGYTTDLPIEAKMAEALIDAFPSVRHLLVLIDSTELSLEGCEHSNELKAEHTLPCVASRHRPERDVASLVSVDSLRKVTSENRVGIEYVSLCSVDDLEFILNTARSVDDCGIVVPYTAISNIHASALVRAINQSGRPAIYARSFFVIEFGGLMALTPTRTADPYAYTFDLVSRVVSGEKPEQLPVDRPSGFELHIGLKAINSPALRPSLASLTRATRLWR